MPAQVDPNGNPNPNTRSPSPSPPPSRFSPLPPHNLPPPPPGPPPPTASRGPDRLPRPRSPPLPPPYNKRPRRDDGRRRGGSPPSRYGNDYGGPGGGRGRGGGYGDDRGHGRYINRSPPDCPEFGRVGDGLVNAPREGLMSYKQFIQELEDDVLPDEAQRRYEEYRSEYITTQKKAYFSLHKEEDWFKNKYHPTNLDSVMERRNELARSTANDFFADLHNGTLDLGPGLKGFAANRSGNGNDVNSEDEADLNGKRRRHGRGLAKDNDLFSAAPEAHPVSSEPRRIQDDIERAQALISKLDAEKGVENNVLTSSEHEKTDGEKSRGGSMGPIVIIRGVATVKGLEGVELLDTLITYLWRIHGVDYYGMSETNEPKGLRHVRADLKTSSGSNVSAVEWEKKLDSFWQDRLQGQDPLEVLKGKDKIDAAATEVLEPYVRKIRDEKYGWKYGCGAKGCTKLFHAPEFVNKHLRLKHPDLLTELTANVREKLYYQNYMNDPNAPGGTPIMQQSAPKERPRNRPSMDSRLKDERVIRRGYDTADRNRGSPTHEAKSGPEHRNPEKSFDPYDDPGMHGASFPSDVPPPPVLMPVPGAGPLGPFVPAPPEVAMRMLRDQCGPPPFEANNGPRPRKGRVGPPIGVPPPVAVPPFLHDPRHIRSYHDLDAPGDEVTVMDFRSLEE